MNKRRFLTVQVPAVARNLHPLVVPTILEAHYIARISPMEEGDEHAYFRWLHNQWFLAGRQPLVIVEHDVIARANVLDSLARCRSPWCCAPYNGRDLLGCTLFVPSALGAEFPLQTAVPWLRLDVEFAAALRKRGWEPCVHRFPPGQGPINE